MRGKEKRLSRLCLQRRNRRENFPFSTCPRRTTLSCEKEVVDQLNFCSLVSRNFFPPQRLPKKKTSLPLLGPRSNVVQFFPPRVVASSTDFVNLLQGKIFSFFSRVGFVFFEFGFDLEILKSRWREEGRRGERERGGWCKLCFTEFFNFWNEATRPRNESFDPTCLLLFFFLPFYAIFPRCTLFCSPALMGREKQYETLRKTGWHWTFPREQEEQKAIRNYYLPFPRSARVSSSFHSPPSLLPSSRHLSYSR